MLTGCWVHPFCAPHVLRLKRVGVQPLEWNVAFTLTLARTYKVWADFELDSDAPAPIANVEGHEHGEGADHSHKVPKAADAHHGARGVPRLPPQAHRVLGCGGHRAIVCTQRDPQP